MQPRSPTRYLLVLALAAAAAFVAPIPYRHAGLLLQSQFRPTFSLDAPVVMFGASTIDTVSSCDTDRSSIAAMTAARLGRPVIDVSFGNQTVEDAANLAGLAARMGGVRTVVFASAWLDVLETSNFGLHDYVAFRILNPSLAAEGPFEQFRRHDTIFTRPLLAYAPFTYRGAAYPGLDGFERTLFRAERDRKTCPENDGHDPAAIEALHYHRMIEHAPAAVNVRRLASLQGLLRASGKSLLFVFLPLDFERLGRFDPAWPGTVRARRDGFLDALRAGGVPVVDMSEALPSPAFIDRWCACTHYGQEGRLLVAKHLAEELK